MTHSQNQTGDSSEPEPMRKSTPARTRETQAFLNAFTKAIEKGRKATFDDTLNCGTFEQIVWDLDRARRQFDSKLFIVVIFGPLKAGKSTLTNALAGQHVSPSGFGRETTLRPSMVLQGEENGIEQYISTDPEVNHFMSQRSRPIQPAAGDPGNVQAGLTHSGASEEPSELVLKVRNSFDDINDYLRGIRQLREIPNVRVKEEPIEALNRVLTEPLPAEPLLTVVRVKGSSMLKDGLAIVDMPGLDGNRSNWRDNPIHEWVINRAEFFLFVQSSVAALNKETCDFLKSIVSRPAKPPVFVIQNIFEADHWRPAAIRRQQQNDQRDQAQTRVEQLLGYSPRVVQGLNLGKAWDGRTSISEESQNWLTESGFPDFERSLSEVLHSERATIQERNNLKTAGEKFHACLESLKTEEKRIAQCRSDHALEIENLNKWRERIERINYRDCKKVCKEFIEQQAERSGKSWLKEIEDTIASITTRLSRKHKGEEINGVVQTEAKKLGLSAPRTHFDPEQILADYVLQMVAHCSQAESGVVDTLLPAPKPGFEDLPEIHDGELSIVPLEEHRLRWLWKASYDGTQIESHLQEVARDWMREVKDRTADWKRQFLGKSLDSYFKKRRKHFLDEIDNRIERSEADAKPKLLRASASEVTAQIFQGEIFTLQALLQTALVSLKSEITG